MNGENAVFYSRQCATCRKLLILLQNEYLLSYFKLYCVDDNIDRYPKTMRVPLMIVNNINKPLVANEIFDWINQVKFIRQQQSMDNNRKIIQHNVLNNMAYQKKGPIAYDQDIMSGISDKFAFKEIDRPLPQNYFGINEEDKHAIFTAPEQSDKMNKKEQTQLIKSIETKRKEQDEEYMKFMKEKQMEAVSSMTCDNDFGCQSNNSSNPSQQQLQQQLMMQQMYHNMNNRR